MSVYLYSMSNSIIIEHIKFLNILGEKGQSQFFLCIIISAMSNKYNDNYQLLILLNLNIFRPELSEVPPPQIPTYCGIVDMPDKSIRLLWHNGINHFGFFFDRLNNMRLVWEELDEAAIDMDEVDKLFCKPPSEAAQKANKARAKSPAKQVRHSARYREISQTHY